MKIADRSERALQIVCCKELPSQSGMTSTGRFPGMAHCMRCILVVVALITTSSAAPNTRLAGPMTTAVQVAPKVPARPAKPNEPPSEALGWLSELWMSVPIVGEQIRGHRRLSRPR